MPETVTPRPGAQPAGPAVTAPPRPRQLQMRRPHLEGLPPLVVPPGYGLRTYRPGDEVHWAAIMGSEGGIGREWTPEKVHAQLIDRPQFEPGCLFFATCDAEAGHPVASATAWRQPPEETRTGYLHMVCALPEHRRQGLGRLVNVAALHYLRERGFTDATLHTDDWRLPAIRSYLALGFVPVYVDDPASDHQARWSAIFAQLLAPPTQSGLQGTAQPDAIATPPVAARTAR